MLGGRTAPPSGVNKTSGVARNRAEVLLDPGHHQGGFRHGPTGPRPLIEQNPPLRSGSSSRRRRLRVRALRPTIRPRSKPLGSVLLDGLDGLPDHPESPQIGPRQLPRLRGALVGGDENPRLAPRPGPTRPPAPG